MLILINRNNGKNLVDNKGERARASKEVGGPLQGKFQPITNQSKDIFNIDNDKNSVNLYRWAS